MARRPLAVDIRQLVLHEAGYKCGNPACRYPLTLEVHHLHQVSEGGANTPENLLPLCPNCHTHHHLKEYPIESLKAWKFILLSLNEAFDRKSIDILLAIKIQTSIRLSGEGLLDCASLIASGLIKVETYSMYNFSPSPGAFYYRVSLSDKGNSFVDGWIAGNQTEAIGQSPYP